MPTSVRGGLSARLQLGAGAVRMLARSGAQAVDLSDTLRSDASMGPAVLAAGFAEVRADLDRSLDEVRISALCDRLSSAAFTRCAGEGRRLQGDGGRGLAQKGVATSASCSGRQHAA